MCFIQEGRLLWQRCSFACFGRRHSKTQFVILRGEVKWAMDLEAGGGLAVKNPPANAGAAAAAAKSLQSCPTLCDPIDGSPPGPSVPGILQARALEWVAISFSTNAGDVSSIPGSERLPGGGSSNLLQYSCLGCPMDRDSP